MKDQRQRYKQRPPEGVADRDLETDKEKEALRGRK